MLPAAAPTTRELHYSGGDSFASGFIIVDINNAVADLLDRHPSGSFSSLRGSRPPAELKIGPGDVLQISIMEAGPGLFSNTSTTVSPSGQVPIGRPGGLQPITVGQDGRISIPYAGTIQAAGLTIDGLRIAIEKALADKVAQPQAMIYVALSGANIVTVGGEVGKAGIIPLSMRGDRLLDVIAAAGGARYPAYESYVRVNRARSRVSETVLLQRVVDDSYDNVFIQPGDDIYISRQPRTFSAFGAAGKIGQYPFETKRLSLGEAVAKAGGLVDQIADPSGVFLFRYEPYRIAAALQPGLKKSAQRYPVVYKLDLRDANNFFLAQRFAINDKDLLLVANADGAQLLKFLALVRGVTGSVSDVLAATYVNRGN